MFGNEHWNQPLRWQREAARDRTRRRVFCASMADIFEDHEELAKPRALLWPIIGQTPNLDWLLLTKRPENILSMTPWPAGQWPTNVWIGTTAENQHFYMQRARTLHEIPARVLFLSCEPLLGPIQLDPSLRVDWVIVGGESGPRARPMQPAWARALRDQCSQMRVPFFFKQWGEWAPERTLSSKEAIIRLGKVSAGRRLDGELWDHFPLSLFGEHTYAETTMTQQDLLDVGPRRKGRQHTFRQTRPIWTENKAKLIERYLYYFLMVTKHGTYLDSFSGPQEESEDTANWAAKLVLQLKPQWLRHLYLFEHDAEQVKRLKALVHSQPKPPLRKKLRDVRVIAGDVNVELPRFLEKHPLRAKEAAFCLLDQRTFECDWSTVTAIARHKSKGNKIELFYFLANSWLGRALAAMKDVQRLNRWWGNEDWTKLRDLGSWERAKTLCERIRDEFGYAYVTPWAIYNRTGGTRIMYFMIHATDHPAAPGLMQRAYERAVEPLETQTDLQLMLQTPE
jgi:three-Cys-motif partner protein